MIYNDYPITDIESDKLGRAKFAKSVAGSIFHYGENDSIVIGICGEWGSGKTSTLNLIEQEIRVIDRDREPQLRNVVVKFNPWNFSNQDQLLKQFFIFLKRELGEVVDGVTILNNVYIVCKIIQAIVKLFGYFSPIVENLSSLLNNYITALYTVKSNKNIDEIKYKINKKLDKQKRKFIIFIDDIDRLNDQEIVQLFQLIKLVANFKNLIYVLSFDKKVVVKALTKDQSEFADEYLEKIVQVQISLPSVDGRKIQKILFEMLNPLIGDLDRERLNELYLIGVYDSFLTLRDVKRFINNFEFNYIPLKKEVDAIDFFIIKFLEIFFPDIHDKFKSVGKTLISGFSYYYASGGGDNYKERIINNLLSSLKDIEQKLFIKRLLGLLLPNVEELQFPYSHIRTEYLKDKYGGRIYIEEKFNLYFELDISAEDVSVEEMSMVITNYNDSMFTEYVMKLFKLGTLDVFIRYIYSQLEKDASIPYERIIFNLLKELYTVNNFLMRPIYITTNSELILILTNKYLLKQKAENDIIAFFENIKDTVPLGVFCSVVVDIDSYIKMSNKENSNYIKINISMSEFKKIEENLCTMVLTQLKENLFVFQPNEFSDMLHFLCNYDCNSLCNWVKKNIKNEQILIIHFLKLLMRNGVLDSDKRYITYGFPNDILTNVILPMDWDKLIKSFITSDDFEKADRDTQRAAIVYFWNKDGKINATDSEIDDFYKKEFVKS